MNFIHTGLAASSEEKADLFFVDILGLEKSNTKTLDLDLAQEIFGINSELLIIHYREYKIDFEILVYNDYKTPGKQIAHSCLQVVGVSKIVERCRESGMKVVQIPKGEVTLTFVSDLDGNLYELKELPVV